MIKFEDFLYILIIVLISYDIDIPMFFFIDYEQNL